MKFFLFDQNNSGGSFVTDDKLCCRLFIEAETAEQANKRAEDLGCYWDGCNDGIDCSCCGDRWYKVDSPINMPVNYGNDIVEYAQYLANNHHWTTPDCRIFYVNGDVKEIFFNHHSN